MPEPDARYWDSAAFLAFLKQEEGRVGVCQQVLNEGDRGDFKIVTSHFTLTEVLHLKGHQPIPVEHAFKVRDVFQRSCINLRMVDRPVGELSQLVVWDDKIKPKDAVHVATALVHGVEIFETYDDGLLNRGVIRHEGFKDLTIRQPEVSDLELFPEGAM